MNNTATTLINGKTLTPQGAKIVDAIEAGLKAMTASRWAEERQKAAESEDEGEWFAPEFAAAREATEGLSWDFDGWQNTLGYITEGSGRIAGVTLAFGVGDMVESGKPGTEDYDTGRILSISGDDAEVGWDSGVKTTILLSDLSAVKS